MNLKFSVSLKHSVSFVALSTLVTMSMSASTLAQSTVIESPSPSSGPTGAQIGGSTAYVPMKHGSCDPFVPDCKTHVLATKSGNLNMKFKVGMICPAGKTVNHLSYRPQGQNVTTVINGNTNEQTYSRTDTIQPFSLKELEQAGQVALGGAWDAANSHRNKTKTVKKTLKKDIDVWGRCSGWANKQQKTFPVTVTATFEDKDF